MDYSAHAAGGKPDESRVMEEVQATLRMQYIQEFYQTVRDHCFKLCVTSPGSSLSGGEQKCLGRCMDRYQDATGVVTKARRAGGGRRGAAPAASSGILQPCGAAAAPRIPQMEAKIAHALAHRVDRILLVMEGCTDNRNFLACLRTADVLGVQNVWCVEAPPPGGCEPGGTAADDGAAAGAGAVNSGDAGAAGAAVHPSRQGRKKKSRIARASHQWLDVRLFARTADAVAALRAGGWAVWATDLGPGATPLDDPGLQLPPRVALVVGTEASGISAEMRAAADRRVFLPMHGFTESLNVAVAAALALQALIAAHPGVRGSYDDPGRAAALEAKWRATAARPAQQRAGVAQRPAGCAPCLSAQRLSRSILLRPLALDRSLRPRRAARDTAMEGHGGGGGEGKLQQFLLLGKAAKGRAMCELITRATAEPGLFTFGELLDLPGVQELSGSEFAAFRSLLELFCYGTWEEYQQHRASLPPLTPAHELKLKQLTVASLGARQKVLPYAVLQAGLSIGTVRDLEDFIITDCFYAGLVAGKLDQRQSCLQVHDVASRDVRPGDTRALADAVGNWLAQAQVVLASLEGEAAAASLAAAEAAARRRELESKQEDLKRSLKVELERSSDGGLLLDEAGCYDGLDEERVSLGAPPSGGGGGPGPMGRPKSRRR
ncbi:csn7 [Scenedesmus sp. PABB004]|nr:csn7 [Scenedesmus sp. PABB004]